MGQGQARSDDDVSVLERDIERLRRRSESLTSELIDRAQPSIDRIKRVVATVQDKKKLAKAVLLSPLVIGGLSLWAMGMLMGAFTQRSRDRRRLKRSLSGRLLLAVRND